MPIRKPLSISPFFSPRFILRVFDSPCPKLSTTSSKLSPIISAIDCINLVASASPPAANLCTNPTGPPLLKPCTLSALFSLLRSAEPILAAACLLITNSPGVKRAGTVSPALPPSANFCINPPSLSCLRSAFVSPLSPTFKFSTAN